MPVKVGVLLYDNGDIYEIRASEPDVEVLVAPANPDLHKGIYGRALRTDRKAIIELPHEVWS